METLVNANEQPKNNDIDLSKLFQNKDINVNSITADVHATNANCPDDRMKFIFKSLVDHLHDFVRETGPTPEELMTAINFFNETGKARNFDYLSEALGVTTLVDSIYNVKPFGATETTGLGPYSTDGTHNLEKGDSIASEGKGNYMFVEGLVTDTQGNPIPNATIDTWQADGDGLYDVQYESNGEPDCRGRLHSAEDGSFAYRAVVPVPYAISREGPVGELIAKLGRSFDRPAHLHVRVDAAGYETLITSLFFKDDPYLTSDVIFEVRSSLILYPETVNDPAISKARGFMESKPHAYVKRNFILLTTEEAAEARERLVKLIGKK